MRRWIDILILAACLMVLGWIFQVLLLDALQKWISHSSAWVSLPGYAATLFIVAALSIALIRLGALGVRFRVKTMLRYPPFWFSAIIVFILVGVLVIYREGVDASNLITSNLSHLAIIIVVVFLGVSLGFVYHGLEVLRSSSKPLRESATEHTYRARHIFDNDADLLAWVLEESPIRHPNQDIFDRATPALRIARLLGEKAPSSIGIVGPYGSGKSSLVNLVEHYLKCPPPERTSDKSQHYTGEIILCRVDGWGRTSGTVAPKILSLAIEEVKRHVDCTSVIALPENYRNAIAGASSVGGVFLSTLLQGTQDPVSQLCRLDNILAAAKLRLVIILEDLDRNVGDKIIKNEMPALLDRLRILNNVSFILAIGSERQFSDILIRICDHVEAIS